MRTGLMLAAALLAPLPAAALATAPDWYRVAENSQLRSYVDRASIQAGGQWTRAEEWAEYREESPKTGTKRVRAVEEIDCAARKLRLVHFTAMKADGTVLMDKDSPDGGALHDMAPGSLWADIGDFVCGTDRSRAVKVSDPMTDSAG